MDAKRRWLRMASCDEVLTFDGDQAGGCAAGAREGGAQLFDARVLTAFDQAGTRAEGAGGHRGDFTLPGAAAGGILCVESIFLLQVQPLHAAFPRRMVMRGKVPTLRVA